MKKWSITATALAISAVAWTAQAEVDPTIVEAVRVLWQDQHKALDAHDVDGVLATYASQDDIMLMGTGPGEHWVGRDEVKDAYSNFTEGFDAHTMQVECGEGAGSRRGEVVWLTAVCNFADKKGEEARQYVINLSAVVVKQDNAWRFHTMHFSHLTGGEPAAPKTPSE